MGPVSRRSPQMQALSDARPLRDFGRPATPVHYIPGHGSLTGASLGRPRSWAIHCSLSVTQGVQDE